MARITHLDHPCASHSRNAGLWRLRYKLSVRDLAAMFRERGFECTHAAVRAWEARFAPVVMDALRAS
jgi:transposase-like protein